MTDSIEIKKVVIRIGKKELELSIEEAKELQDILNKTFGDQSPIYIPYPNTYPVYPVPNYPTWVTPTITWKYWYTGDNSNGTYTISNTASNQ